MKRICLGSDHRGVELCGALLDFFYEHGCTVTHVATVPDYPDYPDAAADVARRVSHHEADRGILFSGTGIGMSVVANKFPGVRAVVCSNRVLAESSRRHNDANVLCLAAMQLGRETSMSVIRHWLDTPYDGGRHDRRLQKIASIEKAWIGTIRR